MVVGLVFSVGAVIAAVVHMREGDERAVIALKVRQFLKVVGGLVAAVFAVLVAVVDPIKLHHFSVIARVHGDKFP